MSEVPESVLEELRLVEWRDRYDVRETTVHPEKILKADVIVFNRNSSLLIGPADADFVAVIAKEIHFHSANATSTLIANVAQGQDGRDGVNGRNGSRGSPDAENGSRGADGNDGGPSPSVFFYAESITFGEDGNTDVPPLVVVTNGGNGGSGGSGGRGGNGADGGNYFPGEQTVNGIIL